MIQSILSTQRVLLTDFAYPRGCYLLKLKFFILKSTTTGKKVEPYIVADTQSGTSRSVSQSIPNTQSTQHEPSGPTAPVFHDLTSRPASNIASEVPSSITLSDHPLWATAFNQVNGDTREQPVNLEDLTNIVRQLQTEMADMRQNVTNMQRSQLSMPGQTTADIQAKAIRSLTKDVQVLRDRVNKLEKANKAMSRPFQLPHSQDAPFINGRKRSLAQSDSISTDPSANWNAKPEIREDLITHSPDQDVRMNDVIADEISTSGNDDDLDDGTNAATSELASRHMVPSSISEDNGDVSGETVVIGATNTGTALEDLGPGEANEGVGMVIRQSTPTNVFARPSLPLQRKSERFGESQSSEYVPSGISSESTATHDIRPASFVPLNRNPNLGANRERKFDSPIAIEGWDNSQDTDYRPSGEVSIDSFRGTPEAIRSRGRGRGRGRGSGSRGDREAAKFKNYSARLTEPAPWESEDWDGTTGTTALIRSPSSRGRTVRQRGASSINRTLTFDTPTGPYKKSRLANSDERPRDEAGRLLRANGEVDRRSVRYHRKKTIPDPANHAQLDIMPSIGRPPATPVNNQTAAAATDSPKTHEDFMRRIYPNGRPTEQAVDDNLVLR